MMDYLHPAADKIQDDTLKILSSHSETAQRLLNHLAAQPYTISVFKTIQPLPFVPDTESIYLGLPATQDYADIEQVIDLAAALVELRQNREGYTRPTSDPLSDENQQRHHLKNLEIILHTFPIIEELELEGYKAVQCIRKTGYGKLYKAWLNEAPYEEFINLYWAMF